MDIYRYEKKQLRSFDTLIGAAGTEREQCPVISVVGAGGKTTTLRRLAEEYVKSGRKAAVITTTHIAEEEKPWFLAEEEGKPGGKITMERILETYGQVWAGMRCGNGKLTMVSEKLLEAVRGSGAVILIEADGAKRKPLKCPAEHEPVILPETTHVFAVYGLDAVGKQFGEVCFRHEYAERLLGRKNTDCVRTEDIALLAASEKAGRKRCPDHAAYTVILNKADSGKEKAYAEEIAERLTEMGIDRVLVTSHR